MRSRSTKFLLPLAAVAAMAVPAVAQARHGSDDPPNHIRREHNRFAEHHRADRDDAARDRTGTGTVTIGVAPTTVRTTAKGPRSNGGNRRGAAGRAATSVRWSGGFAAPARRVRAVGTVSTKLGP